MASPRKSAKNPHSFGLKLKRMAIFSSMAIFAAIFFRPLRRGGLISAIVLSALISPRLALAQYSFEEAPINYGRVQTTDRVAKLAQKLASGEVELEHDDKHDYLPAILRELDIPGLVSSACVL
jgi:hypothetical protein